MIKQFNVSTSGQARLYGEHYAGLVYAKDIVLHPEDIEFGILECDDCIVGQEVPSHDQLAPNDRVYSGILHVREIKIRGEDEEVD
ncbi:hypothetical protein NCTGTJJY_CDS0293 [Serratia phage 92A1]|nr:hypothetical protein NCTGTJJY_CDS0293 [Serratia phage 92A1]